MTRTLLATSFTEGYERGPRYIETLVKHCNIPWQCLKVTETFGMPRGILQAGHFLERLNPCETVIFTDADILMHRPMEEDELSFIHSIEEGQISACPNMGMDQLFESEAQRLAPVLPLYGYENVRVFNTGFVICRTATYRMMFERFKQLWPTFDSAFQHYAKIQLCMCAACRDLGIEWMPTPGHLCSHGHCGVPEGLEMTTGKLPEFNGRTVCFDHRLSH